MPQTTSWAERNAPKTSSWSTLNAPKTSSWAEKNKRKEEEEIKKPGFLGRAKQMAEGLLTSVSEGADLPGTIAKRANSYIAKKLVAPEETSVYNDLLPEASTQVVNRVRDIHSSSTNKPYDYSKLALDTVGIPASNLEEDWKNKDIGAGLLDLGQTGLSIFGGYHGAKAGIKGFRNIGKPGVSSLYPPTIDPVSGEVSLHPNLPKINPVTSPKATTPAGGPISIQDQIRLAREQAEATTRASRSAKAAAEGNNNAVLNVIAQRNAEKVAAAKAAAQPIVKPKAGNPTKAGAVPPIESLPKTAVEANALPTVDTSVIQAPRLIKNPIVPPIEPVVPINKGPLSPFEKAMKNKAQLPPVEPIYPDPLPGETINEYQQRSGLNPRKAWEVVTEYDAKHPYSFLKPHLNNTNNRPVTAPPVTSIEPPTQPGTIPAKPSLISKAEAFGKSPQALEGYFANEAAAPPVEVPLKDQLKAAAAQGKKKPVVAKAKPIVEKPPVVEESTVPDVEAPDAKLQALFEKMKLNEEVNAPPKRGRGRPPKVKEALPVVDTSVVEPVKAAPVVEKPVVEPVKTEPVKTEVVAKETEGKGTPNWKKRELSDAYDTILKEEKADLADTSPLGPRVINRLKQFHEDTYPFDKSEARAIEVRDVLKEKQAAAIARKAAKAKVIEEPKVVEKVKVEEPKVKAKETLPEVDTSVLDEDVVYDPDKVKPLNIRRMSKAELSAEENVAKKAAAKQSRIDAAKKLAKGLLEGNDKGAVSIDLLTGGLGSKVEKFIANRPVRKAAKAARKAVKAADKEFKNKNVEALSDWANERKANYYEHGDTNKAELKKANTEASKKLLKYLKDTGQVSNDTKHLNTDGWKILGPEAKNIKRLIRNVHSESWRGLDNAANLVGWTKNIYLSGGVPGTILNAHGLNILRRDFQARGIKKATKTFAEGVFQPKKGRKFLDENADIVPELIKRGYEAGSEKGITDHYVPLEKFFNRTKVTSAVPKALKLGQRLFEDPLFKRHLPANKLKFALERIEGLTKEGMSLDDAMKMASKDANTFYGGINKSLRHKNASDLAQLFILAPDWQESGLRLAGNKIAATKRAVSGKSKLGDSLYTKALGRSAAVNAGTKLIAALLGKTLKDYLDDPAGSTTLPVGESKGRERQLETMAGSAEEFRVLEDLLLSLPNEDPIGRASKIALNRSSQPIQSLMDSFSNIDRFKNPLSGKDRYGKKIPWMKGVGNRALELSKPFQYQSTQALIELLRDRISAEEAISKSAEGPFRYKSKD